jgi:large subunit ribosomal protein L32
MAGKGLKDVTALNKCSACGQLKRAHVLCPYCVQSIKRWFGTNFQTKASVQEQKLEELERINEELKASGKEPMSEQAMKDKTEEITGVKGIKK